MTVSGGTEYGYAGNGVVLNLTALSNIPGVGGIKDAFDLHNSIQDSGFTPEALTAASDFVLSTVGGKEGRIEGQAAKEIGEKVIQKAAAEAEMIAGKISGFTKHGLNQAISRDGVGVANTAILDAVKNPVKTVMQAEGKVKYVGKDATVVLNKDGKVISTWATSGNGVRAGGQ